MEAYKLRLPENQGDNFSATSGFMPRRIKVYSTPSSYALRELRRDGRLALEKVWAEEDNREFSQDKNSITPFPLAPAKR